MDVSLSFYILKCENHQKINPVLKESLESDQMDVYGTHPSFTYISIINELDGNNGQQYNQQSNSYGTVILDSKVDLPTRSLHFTACIRFMTM